MKCENDGQISLIAAITAANKATRKRGLKLWLAAQPLGRKQRGFVYLVHMYLRWVDDFIDNPLNSISVKRNFISRQREIMLNVLRFENVSLNSYEENYLLYFLQYLIETDRLDFVTYLNNTFKSFEMDIDRLDNDGMFSESELSEYLTLLNESIFKISFLFIPMRRNFKELNGFIGTFFWHVLAVRDFKEDIDAGFINISRENVKRYNLNTENLLEDNKRFLWLRETYPQLMRMLDEELIILSSMPFFVKSVWILSYFNLIGEIIRVKLYNFKFGVRFRKVFKKECQIIVYTILMSIKIFGKVFFNSR